MPQPPRRAGIGGIASPVSASPAMCCPIMNTVLSNSALLTSWPLPVRSRSRNAARIATAAIGAAHDVDDRGAGAQRLAGRPGHVGKPAHELHHLVERRAVLVGAGEKAFERAIDEPRIDRRQRVIAAAEALHRAGRVILEQHVGVGGEAWTSARPSGLFRSIARLRLLRLK